MRNNTFDIIILQINRGNSKMSMIPTGLLYLRLDNNNIHSLVPGVFEEIDHLVSLSLAGNPFTTIDRTTSLALNSLPMLRV